MNHIINSRIYTTKQSIESDTVFTPNQNYQFDLDYLTVLSVEGEKAFEFLQGQISCDVREVTLEHMRQGVMCNLKGRILATLDVLYVNEHQLFLVIPKDLLAETLASLSKTAMLSRVQLHEDTHYKVFGLYVQNQTDFNLPAERWGVTRKEDWFCYQLDPSCYVTLVPSSEAEIFSSQEECRGSLAWHALRLQHHQVEIYPETRGEFLPHRLDMHLSGYLSFNKGCYKGQEIIARTHYRATLKHQLINLMIKTPELIHSGLTVYEQDGTTEVGEVIDYCPIGGDQYIVAVSVLINRSDELKL